MSIDLAVTLRVMSHELRTPIGVMQGYLRMLVDGRVADDARPRVFAQLQQASSRLAQLTRQATDLAHWADSASASEVRQVSVSDVLADAQRLLAETSTPIHVDADTTLRVRTPDAQALVAATSGLVEAVRRRSNRPATLCARLAGPASVSIWAGSASSADHAVGDADASRQPVDLEQGGLGLSLVLASAIVAAHGGQLWCSNDASLVGLTIPGVAEL